MIKICNSYYLGVIVLMLIFVSMYFWIWRMDLYEYEDSVPINFRKYEFSKKRKINPEVGCQFPDVEPFSKVAMKYYKNEKKVVCHGEDWVECNMSECKVTQHILDTTEDVVCHYKDIIHVSDHEYKIAAPVTLRGDAVYRLNRSDGFRVSCTGYDKTWWFRIFSKRWYGYKAGIRPIEATASDNNTINILMVAFDSTSRNGFIRKMPKSYKYLEEDMEAVILKGYNIVGAGTTPAMFPILSGRTELQHPNALQRDSKDIFLDPKMFIFHSAKLHGYETAYYEDMPWLGTFQYRHNGFSSRPADHYLRSFLMEETKRGTKWWKNIKGRYCIGAVPQYLYLFNLTRQFMNTKSKHFCFTFIADISHDDFNLISTADDDLMDFLKHVKTNLMEDTLVIVMGDHGSRRAAIHPTYQGETEERMALLSVILPERLKRQRQDALYFLKINADLLTTPFDIHTTLLDAMGLDKLASDFVVPKAAMKRGLSLLKPIPESRTCAEAGVLPHWCTCLGSQWKEVPADDRLHGAAANALLDYINRMIEEKRELCAERKLTSIEWVISQDNKDLTDRDIKIYQTLILTSPGRAAFEGSMQYNFKTDLFNITSDRDVSRISAYGNEPACVSSTHPHLNKYCYCKNTIFDVFAS